MSFTVQTDRRLIRAEGRSARYVLLSFAAPESAHTVAREPVNIALVIDRSGSMGGSKIGLARQAVVQALRMLKSSDRFAVVAYDHEVDVLVPSTFASDEAVRNAIVQVEHLAARGNTDLGAGWLKGCEEIAQHLRAGQVARCLLVSDGLANHGITDRETLASHAEELRARGITTSTIGVGDHFDERLLAGMARAGAGHYYFIEVAANIPDILTGELGETLEVTARDVAVTARVDRGIDVTTLNGFPVRQDGEGISIRLGDLVSRQDVEVVVRLKFLQGAAGQTARALFSVTDLHGAIREPETDAIWTYADHRANDTQPRNVVVDRAVAKLYAAQAAAEALELNRAGRFAEAVARLHATAERIAQYAGSDPELRAIIKSLHERDERYAQPMMARVTKREHYEMLNLAMSRAVDGKARRRPRP